MTKNTYFVITYGCQMNVHESEKIEGMFRDLGFTPASDVFDAHVIVFNTCCIRESAEDRARGNIGALKKHKLANKEVIIAVGGCMTQQQGAAEKLLEKYKFIDIIYGTQNLFRLKDFIKEQLSLRKKRIEIDSSSILPPEDFDIYRTSGDNAYVNITYGCDNFCAYCIVPYVRGRERSREKDAIIKEVKQIVEEGKYKTITLLGQNVNSYGKTLKTPCSFAQLLNDICKIKGDFKISFMTSHPKDFSDELIDVIAKNDKVSKHIHLPVQSGSSKILKAMNRYYDCEHYVKLIDKIKAKIKNVTLSTDIIVGFPGESEEDFNETIKLIEYVKYSQIYAFMYSKRKGTLAENLPDQIPQKIKNKRVNTVLKLQKQIQKEFK